MNQYTSISAAVRDATEAEIATLRAKLAAAEARIAELEAEYRRLWNAGIEHANSGGTVDAGKPEETYAALFRTLMQSRFWNESIVANTSAAVEAAKEA